MSLNLEEKREEQSAFNAASSGNAPASGKGRWALIALAAVVVAALIGLAYWRRGTKAPEVAAPAAANTTGTVKFLMEQQWRVHMMLAKAESRQVTRQISVTGRVIPAAQHQAIVAPPVGGLIAGGGLPRIGQRVGRGQTIALLRQTPTAAEASQIAAANAQLRIEGTRLESERRGMTEKLNAYKKAAPTQWTGAAKHVKRREGSFRAIYGLPAAKSRRAPPERAQMPRSP